MSIPQNFILFGFLLINVGFVWSQQGVGEPCDLNEPINVCPFKEACVKYDNISIICICRLAHKFPNGTWMDGYQQCTDMYSPWSMYPYENKTVILPPTIEYEQLPDNKIRSSSVSNGYLAKYGRMNSNLGGKGAWCGKDGDGEWIQVDLGVISTVSMIGTQGGGVAIPYTVRNYKIQTTNHPNGTDASMVTLTNSSGHDLIFLGNEDQNTPVYNFFTPFLETRYIRLIPLEKQNLKCLRFEVYGNRSMNECKLPGWNFCSEYATCTDTISAYFCTCFAGYHDVMGNGFECIEVNECRTRMEAFKHNCSEFSTCTNYPGGFTCTCFEGYDGDGFYCEDRNECENAVANNQTLCHQDATCVNNDGAYGCFCNNGYSGDGVTQCKDVNECKSGVAKCHDDAKCINTIGSFYCECLTGYSGNGTICTDINECLKNPCHEDAYCSNLKGSYHCGCQKGYKGSGVWCEDIDECADGIAKCGDQQHCFNYRGGFHCMCPKVMPLQATYNEIEGSILDQILVNFRDASIEDWRYPVDHHAHTIRTIYQLVMRTYNYHFVEVTDPFYIIKVAGNAFGVELYDVRCKDIANISFPNTCHAGYRNTKFDNFDDQVDLWLANTVEPVFEQWATAPPPKFPDPNEIVRTPPPIITFPPRTTFNYTDVNGTVIHYTEKIPSTPTPFRQCGGLLNETIDPKYRSFTTPNFPENYPPSALCIWEIVAPERHNVYVRFEIDTFQLELDKSCVNDYVAVYDETLDSHPIASYCGTKDEFYPKAVRSGYGRIFVVFHTDSYHEYRGFKAYWDILQPRVSVGCIVYNQMSTMPNTYLNAWQIEMEKEDKTRFAPVSRLMACKQYPQCNNSRPGPLVYTFEHFRDDRNEKVCVRWDLDMVGTTYTTKGCEKVKTNKTHTICECQTWGIVGVMGRLQLHQQRNKDIVFELGDNTFWSVVLVIFALLVTFLYLFLKDQWGAVIIEIFTKKEYDSGRIIQMHIVGNTLLAEIFFSIISFNIEASPGGCFFMTFLFYYILQTVFFWLFIYTLFLMSRVQEIFDSDKYNSYKIYLFVGYGVPLAVTISISGLSFDQGLNQTLCWLYFEGTTIWGYSGVIVTLGVGTLVLLCNTIYNAREVKDARLLQEKCLKTMFTTFFVLLSSFYGALSLQTKQFYAQFLFSLFNLLQGFSIAVMYCILRREDPIIKSNQIGPIPDWHDDESMEEFNDTNKEAQFKDMKGNNDSTDDENEEDDSKDVEENDEAINISKVSVAEKAFVPFVPIKPRLATPSPELLRKRSSPTLKPDVENEFADTVDSEIPEFHGSSSDDDQEIMFRFDETENYNVR